MDKDERTWIEEAVTACELATRKGIFIVIVRRQDTNDHADIVISNTGEPNVITELTKAMVNRYDYSENKE
jgi:hypothetical protein